MLTRENQGFVSTNMGETVGHEPQTNTCITTQAISNYSIKNLYISLCQKWKPNAAGSIFGFQHITKNGCNRTNTQLQSFCMFCVVARRFGHLIIVFLHTYCTCICIYWAIKYTSCITFSCVHLLATTINTPLLHALLLINTASSVALNHLCICFKSQTRHP